MAAGNAEPAGTRLVMARYGELFLKSEPVKRHFIGMLLRNIRKALAAAGRTCKYETPRGRILIYGDDPEQVAAIVSRIFGIVDVSICIRTTADLAALSEAGLFLALPNLSAGMSFAVRAKRQYKTGLNSQELGMEVGSHIYDHIPGLTVDLDEPEYEVFVEVRDFGGLVYDKRIPGPGGLPWGTQGRVLVLLSAGIDSPVASWLAMKRGCEITHLYLDAGRWAGTDVTAAAIDNHRKLSLWCSGNPASLVIANNEPLFDRMSQLKVPPRYRCVICKRFMQMVAGRMMAHEGALAIVTGENLGQVASQTLANLGVIADAATVPILRPLITYDKEETITIARRIGTFEAKPGDLACRAVPKMPATAAVLDEVKELEQQMGMDELVETACTGLRFVTALDGRIMEDRTAPQS
ncbi:tRNA uracil 4-sulfurtransferase ThiI [Methanoregula sp.]|uniref:tRNA uracil 4-sulfurtransferase ThiI n=1 Tax=Methanoregula sp. TaxID=2052170 RepID=UPI00237465E5|nr:tRNA uracil 4-sulfurtransferase ThiI [Methanoregula sp.]MDD1686349.1 tRNA 4-thiouridine(8) synthase ThiI [Methanoregula sp.]